MPQRISALITKRLQKQSQQKFPFSVVTNPEPFAFITMALQQKEREGMRLNYYKLFPYKH